MQGFRLVVSPCNQFAFLKRNIYLLQLTEYYASTIVNSRVNTQDYPFILNSPRLPGKQAGHAVNK